LTMNMAIAVLTMLICATSGALELGMESADELARAGAVAHGPVRFVPGRDGNAARFERGSFLTIPSAGVFDPAEGTIEMWVRPRWEPSAKERRCFFHMGGGKAHVTIFKTEGGALRFVYKNSPRRYCCVNLGVLDWKPGEWQHIIVGWRELADDFLIVSRVNEKTGFALGTKKLEEVPENIYIGSRGPRAEPAESDIDSFRITRRCELEHPYFTGSGRPVNAVADCGKPLGRLRRVHDFTTPWNSREVPLPFKTGDAYWRRFKEAGFTLARLVAFSDTWLWGTNVERGEDGKICLDFTDFDRLVDVVRSAGAQPYIRLAYNMPKALSSVQGRGWAYAPPRDYAEWDDLMRRIVTHCNVERKLGVKYFVASLNEGDIAVRRGICDWRTICELYERTARIVKDVDPSAKVGGPALAADPCGAGEVFMREFLRFCRERKLPLDFLCYHGYGRAHPRVYEDMIRTVQAMVREEYPECRPEHFLDEFNLWRRDEKQDNEFGAAYIAASLHYQRRAGLAKSSIVSFNHFIPTGRVPEVIVSHTGPFDKSKKTAARFIARTLTAAGVEKRGILAHPPRRPGYTFGRYTVTVPRERPRLRFFTGLAIKHYPGMDGVTFSVIVRENGKEHVLFERHQRRIAWEAHEVSLDRFAGKSVEVEFRTNCGPGGSNTVADWGAWGEPKLTAGPDGELRVTFDFIERIGEARTGAMMPGFEFHYDVETIARYIGLPLIKGPVVTAPYFVYVMHSMQKKNELPVALDGEGGITKDSAAGVTVSADESGVAILAWRFDLGVSGARAFNVTLRDIERTFPGAGGFRFRQYLVDRTHTNPYYDYVIAKKPDNGGRYNLETGKLEMVREGRLTAGDDGAVRVSFELEAKAVTLIVVAPE